MRRSLARIQGASLFGRLFLKTLRASVRDTGDLRTAAALLAPITRQKWNDPRYGHPANRRRVGGKLYWHPRVPGYPSAAFDRVFDHWLAHNLGLRPYPGLYFAHVAITRACGLHCEHCFEGDALNQPETQTEDELLATIDRTIHLGAAQIVFTGGEPIRRVPFILHALQVFSDRGVQFWINTSAAGLDHDTIKQLDQHGLTGITFSLDHHDPRAHDRFRGKEGCFQNVVAAIKQANAVGLVTALSLCATNEFISESNLEAYARLATELNVTFLQLLEPKPLGNYAGRSVALEPDKRALLELFHDRLARTSERSRRIPLPAYPDLHNRRHGCEGGKIHLYVDARGAAHPCPFCQTVSAPVADLTPANLAEKLICPNAAACRA